MSGAAPAPDDIARRVLAAVPDLDATQQRVAMTLTRLLSQGAPVGLDRLTAVVDLPGVEVRRAVEDLRTARRGEDGRLIACCGLTLRETPHRLHVAGRSVYTWCPWDALMLPQILGTPVRSTSPCPMTQDVITVTVRPDGGHAARPGTAVMSFTAPSPDPGADVVATFCNLVRLFSSSASCVAWIADRRDVLMLTLDDACRLAHTVTRTCFGAVLGRGFTTVV
jgi:alkylmercury lyase